MENSACHCLHLDSPSGLLFLLPSGLVWTKPLQFIAASLIEDVDYNNGAQATVELLVTITDPSVKVKPTFKKPLCRMSVAKF